MKYLPTNAEAKHVYRTLASFFAQRSAASKSREVHSKGVTATGTLEVLPNSFPEISMFRPGSKYHVLLRHSNGGKRIFIEISLTFLVSEDDLAHDIRGATLRILDIDNKQDLDESIMDLLLTTGPRFMVNSADLLLRWMMASKKDKYDLVQQNPAIGQVTWEVMKPATKYQDYYYYSKVAYLLQQKTKEVGYVKFRLVPGTKAADVPSIQATDSYAADTFVRDSSDTRAKSYLKDLYASQVDSEGVQYILQAQFYPIQVCI